MRELFETMRRDAQAGKQWSKEVILSDAATEKYAVSPYSLYHPEVIQANPELFNNAWRNDWNLPPKPWGH